MLTGDSNYLKHSLKGNISQVNGKIEVDLDRVGNTKFSRMHFTSVFQNLLSNSIKYRDEQRPLVVKIRANKKGTGYVFVIADNGIGINLKLSGEKMFGIFKRFHTHVEGEGVGLHIVKSIIDAYDGTIEVQSEPGKGTKFEIVLNTLNLV